jgi:hypothetical protein
MGRMAFVDRVTARALASEVYTSNQSPQMRRSILAERMARYGLSYETAIDAIEKLEAKDSDGARQEIEQSGDQPVGIDVATILLIIKLILMFWDYWNQRGVLRPSPIPLPGEPGACDIDEAIEVKL